MLRLNFRSNSNYESLKAKDNAPTINLRGQSYSTMRMHANTGYRGNTAQKAYNAKTWNKIKSRVERLRRNPLYRSVFR